MSLCLSLWPGAGPFDVTLKALLVLVIAGCLAAVLHKAAASARHAIWLAAVALLIALPVAALTLPQLPLPLLPAAPSVTNGVDPSIFDNEGLTPTAASPRAMPEWASAILLFVNACSQLAVAVWAAGFFLLIVRGAVGLVRLDRLRRGAEEVDDAGWQKLVGMAKKRAGLERDVRLLVSRQVRAPISWGLWRIYVLLPARAGEWTLNSRRMVLAHELTHAHRGDWLWQLLAILMTAAHWFNPLAWWAAHRLRMEAENACDDEVIKRGCSPSDYADCLFQLVRAAKVSSWQASAAIPMARPSELPTRMARILDDGAKRRESSFRALVLILAVSTVLGSVFAAASVVRAQPEISDQDSTGLEIPPASEEEGKTSHSEAARKVPASDKKPDASAVQHLVAEAELPGAAEEGAMSREERAQEFEGAKEEFEEGTSAKWIEGPVSSEALIPDEEEKALEVTGLRERDDQEEMAIASRDTETSRDEGEALSAKAKNAGDSDSERDFHDNPLGFGWYGRYDPGEWLKFGPESYRVETEFLKYKDLLIKSGLDDDQVEIAMSLITERVLFAKTRNMDTRTADRRYARILRGRAGLTDTQTRIVLGIADQIAYNIYDGKGRA